MFGGKELGLESGNLEFGIDFRRLDCALNCYMETESNSKPCSLRRVQTARPRFRGQTLGIAAVSLPQSAASSSPYPSPPLAVSLPHSGAEFFPGLGPPLLPTRPPPPPPPRLQSTLAAPAPAAPRSRRLHRRRRGRQRCNSPLPRRFPSTGLASRRHTRFLLLVREP
jgi:hypothetical protein